MKAIATSNSMACSDDESENSTTGTHSVSRLLQIALAFAIVFFPLVFVATLLCLFVTIPTWTIQIPPQENVDLPVSPLDESFFATKVLMNSVALTSSFASNAAQLAASPFLLLFSFLVALELANRHEDVDQDVVKLLQGEPKFLFNWTLLRFWRARNAKMTSGTRIAGVGAFIALVLTISLLIGDKVLSGTLDTTVQRSYSSSFVDPDFNGAFAIDLGQCLPNKTVPDIYNNYDPPPCSIDNTTDPWTLTGSDAAYRVLATGLLNQTSNYNEEDFDALVNASNSGAFGSIQLVTHVDRITDDQHIFLFNPWWAQEDDETQRLTKWTLKNENIERSGFDYIADTMSIVTRCTPITADCGMHNATDNNASIPYDCSELFNGDLNEIPNNGLERLKGWNTKFFDLDNGSPRGISVASQLNPFSYNVTAVVDSINLDGLARAHDPQVHQGTVVGIGNGRVAFAISCTSTVYDVTYSLVNGNIYAFHTTLAAPSTAAIIKAPLQAGFGSYELFERAAMSMLLTNSTVMDPMELAFSQTLLALAAGVYTSVPNRENRWRGDMTLTRIGRGSFYFLVVSMFLYAVVVVVFTVLALSVFWRNDVRELQARLIP